MFTVYEKGIGMMKKKLFVGKTGLIPGVLLRDEVLSFCVSENGIKSKLKI